MNSQNVSMNSAIDPYVYQTLLSIQGAPVVVQTTQGSVRGGLKTVMPDHIVVEVSGTPFFVRTQQIVWVYPDQRYK
ncbi:YuzF family protein [Halobacillus litoralis]|uniref:YuzF family protein n=1 Tax=Halobacillus litoralis TaxID=45668 RepID=UPI001CFC61FB|nr:YuzF family protein [Halobacillus litoralis]WLR46442.1 YuzF family protein [Halobacillus litoralis]